MCQKSNYEKCFTKNKFCFFKSRLRDFTTKNDGQSKSSACGKHVAHGTNHTTHGNGLDHTKT